MDEDRMLVIIGFAIVLVVALNILIVFGDMFKLGGGLQMISGFATAECKNAVGGISCDGTLYPVKPQSEGCTGDNIPICTNACELERAQNSDDRVCPSYCTEFCLPINLAAQILNSKQK